MISAAEQNARREHDAVHDNADRQSDMLIITASAQPTAVRQVYNWLAAEARSQSPNEFASTVARSSLRLRSNLEGIAASQPKQTLIAVDRLMEKTRSAATQFDGQQTRIATESGRAASASVQESIDRLAGEIAKAIGKLEDLPVRVRSSADGFLDPMGEAFTSAVISLTQAVNAAGGRVKQALEGAPGNTGGQGSDTAANTPAATPAPPSPNPAQRNRGGNQPRGPPAPSPASCTGCGAEAGADAHQTDQTSQPQADGDNQNTPKAKRELWQKIKGNPTEAPEITDFFRTTEKSVADVLGKRVEQINSALAGIVGPNIDLLMSSLRGLTQKQGAAIRFLHNRDHSPPLDQG
jgi:hypothetical protein